MGDKVKILLKTDSGIPLKEMEYLLTGSGSKEKEGKTQDNGLIEETDFIPGKIKFKLKIEK